jgi:tetratricopeptide (TPR) repeat protein
MCQLERSTTAPDAIKASLSALASLLSATVKAALHPNVCAVAISICASVVRVHDLARNLADESLRLFPHSSGSLAQKRADLQQQAATAARRGHPVSATEAQQSKLALAAPSDAIWFAKARAELALGMQAPALSIFRQAFAAKCHDAEMLVAHLDVEVPSQKGKLAMEFLHVTDRHPVVLCAVAQLYLRAGKPVKAVEHYREALLPSATHSLDAGACGDAFAGLFALCKIVDAAMEEHEGSDETAQRLMAELRTELRTPSTRLGGKTAGLSAITRGVVECSDTVESIMRRVTKCNPTVGVHWKAVVKDYDNWTLAGSRLGPAALLEVVSKRLALVFPKAQVS